ncbi:MAG: hypothetical protein ACPLPR_09605 [Bacillota bacterium]
MRRTVCYVSTYPPRECGIASFTFDLTAAVSSARCGADPFVVAMVRNEEQSVDYGPPVRLVILHDEPDDYLRAADEINQSRVEYVSLG